MVLEKIETHNTSNVREMMYDSNAEVEARSSREWIAKVVNVGDDVCVDNSTNESFWILLVDKGMHTIQESFKDDWNNEYVEGDVVLRGIWYDKLFPNSRSYLLRNDKSPSYVFSHLILASKFPVPPTSHIIMHHTNYQWRWWTSYQTHLKQQNYWIKFWVI
jgi:hypothetical protein